MLRRSLLYSPVLFLAVCLLPGYIGAAKPVPPLGTLVIPARYDYAELFNEGLTQVKLQDKYGYLNTKGKVIIPLKYDLVQEFSEGFAAVQIGNKWGYITRGPLK